ncbi:hypothetical protein CEXT_672741 [Caerostris extrusa]|uniref:Uncharacterized protein n=1 Tax=Caerostris extrusa TaxID=172846 RepID=A0AAV4QU43_CAEEX|nr:hypothetical protein CEXT_672741 [Caerostris extrusa]
MRDVFSSFITISYSTTSLNEELFSKDKLNFLRGSRNSKPIMREVGMSHQICTSQLKVPEKRHVGASKFSLSTSPDNYKGALPSQRNKILSQYSLLLMEALDEKMNSGLMFGDSTELRNFAYFLVEDIERSIRI